MKSLYSSIKWTRKNNINQTAQTSKVSLRIRFFYSHENQYCLYVTSPLIPVWKWAPYFQFSTESEARDFGLLVANYFEANPDAAKLLA